MYYTFSPTAFNRIMSVTSSGIMAKVLSGKMWFDNFPAMVYVPYIRTAIGIDGAWNCVIV
jgi:hypothetical protein